MTRQVILVFGGVYRGVEIGSADAAPALSTPARLPHESPRVMTFPLVVLAVFAALLGFLGTPLWPWFQRYLGATHGPVAWLGFFGLMLTSTAVVGGVALAQRRSDEWMRPRLRVEADIPTLDLAGARRVLTELSSAPGFLSKGASDGLARIRDALETRIGVLEELEVQVRLSDWRGRFPELSAVATLDRGSITDLLQGLQEPPAPLAAENLAWRDRRTNALTARLDELSLDDLFDRIARLSPAMRGRLLERLQALV